MFNRRILVVGPFPEPITGVSHCNSKIYEFLKTQNGIEVGMHDTSNPNFSERIGTFSFKKILFYLKLNLGVYKVFGQDIIYLTPGQTFFGILKYAGFILVAKTLRKEVIIHIHGDYLFQQYNVLKGLKKKIFHFLVSRADKGIVLSESLKRNLLPFLPNSKIYVLYNFAENILQIEKANKNYDELRVVFMSNLIEEKGINEFLDALLTLQNCGFPFKARIAGLIDPDNKIKLLQKIDSITNVEYLGVVKGIEKKDLLSWSNVFILPTYFKMEGQPISILEAMAAGNVVISTAHGGIPDILVEGVNGYFVKKKDPESIAEKIIYLKQNPDIIETIGLKNIETYLAKYTFGIFKTQFLKILRNE